MSIGSRSTADHRRDRSPYRVARRWSANGSPTRHSAAQPSEDAVIWLLPVLFGLTIAGVATLLGFDSAESLIAGLTALLMMAGLVVHHLWYINR